MLLATKASLFCYPTKSGESFQTRRRSPLKIGHVRLGSLKFPRPTSILIIRLRLVDSEDSIPGLQRIMEHLQQGQAVSAYNSARDVNQSISAYVLNSG